MAEILIRRIGEAWHEPAQTGYTNEAPGSRRLVWNWTLGKWKGARRTSQANIGWTRVEDDLSFTLTLANWNLERIRPSQRRLLDIRKYFSETSADIWFLTETHEEVQPNAEFFSRFSGIPDRLSREGERWVSIWSRWPIENLDTFVNDPARCAAGRIEDSPFGELIVYGTILPWNNAWRDIPGAKGQAFEAALDLQKRDWFQLRENFPQATLILAGDFNQDLADWHYYGSRKKRSLLEAALFECNLTALTSGLGDPIARDSAPNACIDHICISSASDWVLDSTKRWPDAPSPVVSLSDHFGVSVQLVHRRNI